jgi:hypothetical protein
MFVGQVHLKMLAALLEKHNKIMNCRNNYIIKIELTLNWMLLEIHETMIFLGNTASKEWFYYAAFELVILQFISTYLLALHLTGCLTEHK